MFNELHEECGVFGITSNNANDDGLSDNIGKNRFEQKISERY